MVIRGIPTHSEGILVGHNVGHKQFDALIVVYNARTELLLLGD